MNPLYEKLKLPTPQSLKNKYFNRRALVIGTGMSTKKIIQYKHKLQNKFDAIIGVNLSTIDFEKQMTHHLIIEKNPIAIYSDMKNNPNKYRKDLPRILNFKGLHRFPQYLNIIKAGRTDFGGNPNIREYEHNNFEGLLIGPQNRRGFSVGTVSLQALHLAGILGCTEVYFIGVDLTFGNKFDHYYEDRSYRDGCVKSPNKSSIVKVLSDGVSYETTEYFRDSAAYLDEVINNMCRPIGMEVYSFSDGLLAAPIKVNIDKFME